MGAVPAQAQAAAWIPDRPELINTSESGVRGRFYNTAYNLYADVPVRPRLSVVATGRYEITPARPSSVRDVGEAMLALKAGMPLGSRAVGAVQFGPTWRNDLDPDCSGFGGEARALVGLTHGRAFLDVQAGARIQSSACVRALYQATLGYRPSRDWLGLAQVFVDDDLLQGSSTTTQISLVRNNAKGVGLQIGARFGFGAQAERTFVLGYWRRFGRANQPAKPPSQGQ